MSAFEELGVHPDLIRGVEDLGWSLPTAIQAEAIPLILGGGDVMAAAETGSGKTGAFALPLLQGVHEIREGLMQRGSSVTVAAVPGAKRARAGDAGDAGAAPLATAWNPEDRDDVVAVGPEGLTCQARNESAWGGIRATVGTAPAGDARRCYFEVTVRDEGLCRVGLAAPAAALEIGTDAASWGFGGTGRKSTAGGFEPYGKSFGRGDVVGVRLDWGTRRIGFSVNGQDLGTAFELPQKLQSPLFPAASLKNAELEANFGARPWRFPPPAGFQGFQLSGDAEADTGLVAWAPPPEPGAGPAHGPRRPLALVLEPTRDLAEQTHENVQLFSKFLPAPGIEAVLLVGGVSPKPAERALAEGADVVTGTPGRIIDFVESGKLVLDDIRFFVLDEADRLLDDGNIETIRKLFRRMPKAGAGVVRLQSLLFSATLHSPEVKKIAAELCQNPILVDLKGRDAVPDTVDHVVIEVNPVEDRSWLQTTPEVQTDGVHTFDKTGPEVDSRENWSEAVKKLKPRLLQRCIHTLGMEQALIFCRTNLDCDHLERFLVKLGGGQTVGNAYSCAVLAGQRSMDERRAALAAFKAGEIRFLIATDVAARGLDIQGLPFVVNMTLPDRTEDYVHRVGRVGRADALGLAVSLVASVPEKVWYASGKGQKPWQNPTQENTQTNDHKGGQTIWMDEPGLLKAVEKRLRQEVQRLPADLALPPAIAERLKAGYGGTAPGDDPAAREALLIRLAAVQPALAALARLEKEAQASFFGLKRRWSEVASLQSDLDAIAPLKE